MRINSKGQVTIPKRIREKYGFLPNTEVEFEEKDGMVRLVKKAVMQDDLRQHLLKATGSATIKMRTEEIMQLVRDWDEPNP